MTGSNMTGMNREKFTCSNSYPELFLLFFDATTGCISEVRLELNLSATLMKLAIKFRGMDFPLGSLIFKGSTNLPLNLTL